MIKTVSTLATAGALALGLATTAMAGGQSVPGAPSAGASPTEIAASIQARVQQQTGFPVTVTANTSPDGMVTTYTVTFPSGFSQTYSSATVAYYMAAYSQN